nr:MAG TPA: hypothetical protein [Caudoviricetes sp.]
MCIQEYNILMGTQKRGDANVTQNGPTNNRPQDPRNAY